MNALVLSGSGSFGLIGTQSWAIWLELSTLRWTQIAHVSGLGSDQAWLPERHGGKDDPSQSARPVLPSARSKASAPRLVTFEAQSHGLRDSLSTLRSPSHPGSTQDSVPAAGWAWPGGLSAGSRFEVSGRLRHPSSSTKLCLAQ